MAECVSAYIGCSGSIDEPARGKARQRPHHQLAQRIAGGDPCTSPAQVLDEERAHAFSTEDWAVLCDFAEQQLGRGSTPRRLDQFPREALDVPHGAGRVALWNGRDLSGWTLYSKDGGIDSKSALQARGGVLRLDSAVSGYDIFARGDSSSALVNGVLQNHVRSLPRSSGRIALQLEGMLIELRELWLEPAP